MEFRASAPLLRRVRGLFCRADKFYEVPVWRYLTQLVLAGGRVELRRTLLVLVVLYRRRPAFLPTPTTSPHPQAVAPNSSSRQRPTQETRPPSGRKRGPALPVASPDQTTTALVLLLHHGRTSSLSLDHSLLLRLPYPLYTDIAPFFVAAVPWARLFAALVSQHENSPISSSKWPLFRDDPDLLAVASAALPPHHPTTLITVPSVLGTRSSISVTRSSEFISSPLPIESSQCSDTLHAPLAQLCSSPLRPRPSHHLPSSPTSHTIRINGAAIPSSIVESPPEQFPPVVGVVIGQFRPRRSQLTRPQQSLVRKVNTQRLTVVGAAGRL